MKSVSVSQAVKQSIGTGAKPLVTEKAVKVLASAIFRQLQSEGCEPRHIISVSSQLIDLVTSELQKDDDQSL